jgi:hypothetical protein
MCLIKDHPMKTYRCSGGIAPHILKTRYYMGLSGQFHAPAALAPQGKSPRYPLGRRLGETQSRCRRSSQDKNTSDLARNRTPDVQPVVA